MAGFNDTEALLNAQMSYYVNIGSGDADNSTNRARCLQFSQEAMDEIWFSGDYLFSYITASVTITAAGSAGDLPADFMEFGEVGGIFDDALDEQMQEIRPVEAYGAVISGVGGEGQGLVSQFGLNATTHARTLQMPGNVVTAQTIKILYRKVAPTLVDTSTDVDSNLLQLPRAYHNTVLLPRAVSKILKSLGDMRWKDSQAEYERGLGRMAIVERHRKTSVQKLPSSIRMF